MEELIAAVILGLFAGAVLKKLSDSAKTMPVFKDDKISDYKDILTEAHKAKNIGADSASILLAFGAIESSLRKISGHNESGYSVSRITSDLLKAGEIDNSTADLIRQLNKIRNETSHSIDAHSKYSETKVSSYLESVRKVLSALAEKKRASA
ncbi:hypothetical protein AU05_17610 [Ectopseudomonas composti]|uniref:DUF4145 domain-containing protein n=1 Tax=Ectopseudomonas composti TaxID=658457 RepID=A0ABN0SA48_9GAMM|nr:hypothetical protein [Pseudomonas composti]EZH79201.1 hypothetical protein AU05_17610 [Pseudomonas composti]